MNGIRKSSALHPDATLIILPADGSKELAAEFCACVHCQRIWHVGTAIGDMLAQKVEFGFCAKCNGITCPNEKCQTCVPVEQWLENVEAGRAETFRPTRIAVPQLPICSNPSGR